MQDPTSVLHVDFKAVFIVFTAVIFGALGAGEAGSYAPDYAAARESANSIFSLLDREPAIDSYSEEGLKPVSTLCGDAPKHE